MKAVEAQFLSLLGSDLTQFVIPVYQRVYSWDERECQDLWDDVMRAGKNGKQHFIGSFLYTPQSATTATSLKKKLLIDGQQRMTTLSLLLAAFFEWLEEDVTRGSFLEDIKVSALRKRYLYNDDDYIGDSRYRLVLSQDDRPTLFAIVGKTPLPDSPSQRIVSSYEFFKRKIQAKHFDAKSLWNGVKNLLIIDTELSAETDNAQLIFESMNSKGKPLTPIDLIRNYILMRLDMNTQTTLYESYWRPIELMFGQQREDEFNAFIWYWLWLKVPKRTPKENEAYQEFKGYCEDNKLEDDPKGLLEELRQYATRYVRMFMNKEQDPDLAPVFRRITNLGVKPVRPLMLSLYALYESGRLSKADFIELCTYLESFLFRRAVIGRFTTGLNNFFAGMYQELEKAENPKEYVLAMLLSHGEYMTAYFPTDEVFVESLKTRDLYHRFSKGRYCLERYESFFNPKEPVPGNLQIEHVMPQSIETSEAWQEMLGKDWTEIHDELCNTLGNLTLTGYNQEYSNRPFEEKLNLPNEGFKSSSLHLNKFIAQQTVWDKKTIEKRSELLAQEALSIWPYPELDESIVGLYRPKSKQEKGSGWTLEENHPLLAKGGICCIFFEELVDAVSNDFPDWEMYITKYYVGFKEGTKLHLCVEGRSTKGGWLALGLSRQVEEYVDPYSLCQDKTIGPAMPTRVDLIDEGQIPALVELLKQE